MPVTPFNVTIFILYCDCSDGNNRAAVTAKDSITNCKVITSGLKSSVTPPLPQYQQPEVVAQDRYRPCGGLASIQVPCPLVLHQSSRGDLLAGTGHDSVKGDWVSTSGETLL